MSATGASQPTQRATNFAMLVATACIWGLNWSAVKILLETNPPWSLRTAGLAGGAILLTSVTWGCGYSMRIPRAAWDTVVVAGILNVAIFNVCTVFAQLSMPTSRAAILTFTMPLWVTVFAWWFLGEVIDRRRLSALAIGVAGLGVLAIPFWPVIARGNVPFGLVYVLGAALSWALGTVWLKANPVAAPPLAITAWQVIVAAVVCAACMMVFETPRLDITRQPQFLAFTYHVLLPQGLSYVMWFSLLGRLPASTLALGTLLVPVFSVIGAVMILGDWPTQLDLVGLALILAAVGLDQFRATRKPAH